MLGNAPMPQTTAAQRGALNRNRTDTADGWLGRRILVTGASGFIGSHVAERCVTLGARVRAHTHYNSRSDRGWIDRLPADVLAEIDPIAGDLADLAHVREAVRGCDVVLHLGAQVSIPHSYDEPWLFIETNVIGTFNVLTAVRELEVSRLVIASTSEVYGSARYVPMDEQHPLQAQSPYAATKIAAEKLAESYHRSFAVPVVTLRPFNAFGPRQSARAVIPAVISQALWRDEIRLGSLEPLRDFNYVANTVDAFIAAASVPGVEGEVFNVGSGRDISVGDLAQLVSTLVGRGVPVVSEPRRERPPGSEVNRLQADSKKAAAGLGWAPRVSLEDGLRLTIDWIRAHPESFDVGRYAT